MKSLEPELGVKPASPSDCENSYPNLIYNLLYHSLFLCCMQAQWCVCSDQGADGAGPDGHHAVIPHTQGAGWHTLHGLLRTTRHPPVRHHNVTIDQHNSSAKRVHAAHDAYAQTAASDSHQVHQHTSALPAVSMAYVC